MGSVEEGEDAGAANSFVFGEVLILSFQETLPARTCCMAS